MSDYKVYAGTDPVVAKPMRKDEFYAEIGVHDSVDYAEGYIIKLKGDGIRWSPKKDFEKTYKRAERMNFPTAMFILLQGYKVARKAWNGNPQYITAKGGNLYIYKTHDGHIPNLSPWTIYSDDIFTNDWFIVGKKG